MGAEAFNASAYLVDSHVAAGRAQAVALAEGERSITYAELSVSVARLGGALRGLGIGPGDRVLLYLLDGPEWIVTFLGAQRIGAVPVPVNTMLTSGDLVGLAKDARPRVAFVAAGLPALGGFLQGIPWLEHLVVVGPLGSPASDWGIDAERIVSFEEFSSATPAEAAPTTTRTSGFWLYTSGTTGSPRAAMHRQVDLRTTAESFGAGVLGIRPDDVAYSVSKLFFAYGLGNSLTFPLSVGASVVLDRRPPSPTGVAQTAQVHRPTLFFAVPSFYASLLAAEVPRDSFDSVRIAISAGERLPAEILRRFHDRFGVEIVDGLGSTEALHTYLSNRPGEVRPGTCGTLVPGYEVRVVDEAGHQAAPGQPGQLMLKGDSLATGYWGDAGATERAFCHGWLRTGDVFSRSADGVFTHLGRSNDMLKAGGIWVAPAEVEATLLEHPGVLEAAVVGQRDDIGIERLVAFVVAESGAPVSEAELAGFVRGRLAPFKRPRRFVFVSALPRTATGKLRRADLRSGAFEAAQVGEVPSVAETGRVGS